MKELIKELLNFNAFSNQKSTSIPPENLRKLRLKKEATVNFYGK